MARDSGREIDRRGDLTQTLGRRSRRRRTTLSAMAQVEPIGPSRRNDLLLDCRLEYRPPDSLKRPPRNVRTSSADQISRVMRSIAELGTGSPAIITHDGEVVDGLIRVEAARRLGLATYPCFVLPVHYTMRDVRLLRTSLNRTQELGGWSLPELKVELEDLRLAGAALDATGFTLPEIDQICLDEPALDPDDEDLEPEAGRPVVSRADDLWELGSHRVLCGDARGAATYQRLCDGDPPARLCLTDVPYNLRISGLVTSGGHGEFAMASGEMTPEEFAAFNAAWMSQVIPRLIGGGLLATFIDWRSVELVLRVGRELDLRLINVVVWAKSNAGQGSLWRSQHEMLPVFKKGDDAHCNNVQLGRHGRWRSNLWTYPGASSLGSDAREGLKSHPTGPWCMDAPAHRSRCRMSWDEPSLPRTPTLPFKLHADHRRHIPRQKHRVTNWPAYEAGLRQRGSLTVWFTDAAIAAWRAEPRSTPGGQRRYSGLAITTAPTLRSVFGLALRQTEGLIGSIIGLLNLDIAVPTTPL